MSLPSSNGLFIHNGINCSPAVVPTAQSIPMSPSDSTTVKTAVDNKSDLSIIADEYDTSATYTLGDFVIYDKVLYKCITYSTTGAWDSTRWVAVNIKDSGINLKNSSGNNLVKVLENTSGDGVVSLYDKTTGYETISMHSYGDIDAKSITVMTSGYSNSGRIELTTTQSNSGYISLRDNYKNTPIDLNADDGNINAISLNGVTIGSSPKFTDTTYESKSASSGGTDLSLVTTGEKYTWNNKASTNTTYTFTNGTNGFTVTPSGGSAQTVTITPSITNNVTGSGTSGYIAKFNSANTITNGPAFGSSTSTYLRNDGSWATPSQPSVGNGTITIQLNGTNKGSFTTNQSGNGTININGVQTTLSDSDISSQFTFNSTYFNNPDYKRAYRYGNVVHVVIRATLKANIPDNSTIFGVSSSSAPKAGDYSALAILGSGPYDVAGFRKVYYASWDGTIKMLGTASTGNSISIDLTWIV